MMAWALILALTALPFGSGVAASCDFRTDPWIGEGMVFQRGKPFEVSGNGCPGDVVTVTLGGSEATGTVDAHGRWKTELPPFSAGGPFVLSAVASSGARLEMSDVYAGDVWICAGQSNMEMPVWGRNPFYRLPDGQEVSAAASDSRLRMFKVPKATALLPQAQFAEKTGWQGATTSDAVEDFSAVGYLFGCELRRRHPDVPIGLVGAYWGGTRIEPWISEKAFAASCCSNEVAILAEARRADFTPHASEDEVAKYRAWLKAFEAEFEKRGNSGAWKPGDGTSLTAPGVAECRFTFEVKPESVGHDFVFHVDAVDDADITFLDGREIGATTPLRGDEFCWEKKRDYAFKVDRPGRHEIILRGYSFCGPLCLSVPICVLDRTDGTRTDLGARPFEERTLFQADLSKLGGSRPIPPEVKADPRKSNATPAVIFNAMVAPLKGMRVTGTIWFQGCANSYEADRYADLGRTLVEDWRGLFRSRSLPFLVAQLGSFKSETPRNRLPDDFWRGMAPDDSGFAFLREAQYDYGTDPGCGIACAIDIGDHSNIHFPNKREVGRRLAHEAFRVAYGEKGFAPGPSIARAFIRNGKVVVKVKDAGGGLVVDGDGAISSRVFSLADKEGALHWAKARIAAPDEIEVESDAVAEPKVVRYAFTGYAGGNLVRRAGDGLPLFPFRAKVPNDARWISGGTKDRTKPAPWLEKVFSLEKAPAKAVLTLAVAGWHEVYVNGTRIGEDVLSPVTCQPDKRISSVSHDVTAFLRQGENRLSVLLGNGWFNCFTHEVWGFKDASWMKEPMIRGELVSDGQVLFVTDGSWTAFDSPITFNALRGGEDYDARREGVRGNPRAATVVKYTPSGAVSPEDAVPCRAFEPIGPKRIFRSGDGATIYDFGSNRTGWCELEVAGEAGATVTLDYDESITPTNTLKGHVLAFMREERKFQRDTYTLAGRAEGESWHPRFTYHGFRYVRVQIKGRAEVKTLRSVFIHSAFERAGVIRTSDPLFTRLQDATMRSYLSNFTGIPTDCPHREKNGWTGDTQLALETGMWNWKARASYVHFLRMMLDAQRPDGAVPCILPCSEKFGFYWGSGPAWDAVLFEVPWQIWRFEGDDAVAKEAWPAMKRYLAFIDSKADEKGLVEYGLGDWCAPGDIGAPPVRFTDSCFVYEFNRRAAFWADRFGEKEAAVAYRARTKELKAAINEAYYKGDGLYADGRLTSLAAPLYFKGLCADGEEEKVFGRLLAKVRAGKHTCGFGILGAKWVPRVLASRGAIDDAWKIFTQRSQPGYQWWLDQGEDTLWETFDGSVSHNHIMFGDLSAWAYEHVAGIIPLEPGFRKIRFAPHCPEGVATFEAWHLTPHGEIRAGWRLGADGKPECFCEAPTGVEVLR